MFVYHWAGKMWPAFVNIWLQRWLINSYMGQSPPHISRDVYLNTLNIMRNNFEINMFICCNSHNAMFRTIVWVLDQEGETGVGKIIFNKSITRSPIGLIRHK